MSRLDELIKKLCPEGVSFHALSDCFDQFSGMGGVSNKWADEGNCQFVDYINAYTHIAIDVNNLPYATVKRLNQTVLKQGDILFTSASETPDECAISSVIEGEIKDGVFLDDHLFGLRIKDEYIHKICPSFLKYTFRAEGFRTQIKKAVRGVTRFYVSKPDFMKLIIPVPPLEVQREIVRILDNFTELTAELSTKLAAELSARRKQHEYYRNRVFDLEDCSYFSISDIADTNIGLATSVTKHKRENGIRLLHNSDIQPNRIVLKNVEFISEEFAAKNAGKILHKNDIITVHTGDVGTSAVIDDEFDGSIGFTTITTHIRDSKVVLPQYLCHYLNSHRCKMDIAAMTISDRSNLNQKSFEKLIIPIPSMVDQKRVIAVLDQFDVLCSDIVSGLPAEIEARQKQFEYYRDKLHTFRTKI